MARVVRKPGPRGGTERLSALLSDLDGIKGKVGWLESAKYEDGTPVAYVAAIQEFGHSGQGIPPRPFLRPTVTAKTNAWRASLKSGASAVLTESLTPRQLMESLVLLASGNVAQTIAKLQSPPLAEATLRARAAKRGVPFESVKGAGAKPLVFDGILLGSLSGTVE